MLQTFDAVFGHGLQADCLVTHNTKKRHEEA